MLVVEGPTSLVGQVADVSEGVDVAPQGLLAAVVEKVESGLALLDGTVVFAEESDLLVFLLVESFVVIEKLFILVQFLQF